MTYDPTNENGILEKYFGEDGEDLYEEEWIPILTSINADPTNYNMNIYSPE
jgi:hypothetical protein